MHGSENKKELKIISLNTWGGNVGDKLFNFIEKNKDVDVFCFQEIFDGEEEDHDEVNKQDTSKDFDLLNKIKKILSDHKSYFDPCLEDFYGIATFIKKDINVLEQGEKFIYQYKGFVPNDDLGFHARNLQYVKININNKDLYIINLHGLWNGQGKTDTKDRIEQSKKIVSFLESIDIDFVLCGDFNLLSNTESIKMIEDIGASNLIKDYNIKTTRTSLYDGSSKFADYVFTSKDLEVSSFKVLSDVVSDHSPLEIKILL